MKNIAVILSAGSGTRFGTNLPKQYNVIYGKPVIYYTIKSFVDAQIFDAFIIVMHPDYYDFINNVLESNFPAQYQANMFHLCEGGSHRQESLYFGVMFSEQMFYTEQEKTSNIAIFSHCAARPVVPKDIILKNHEAIEQGYSVNTVKNIYDTVIYENDDGSCSFVERTKTFLTLTPQSFISSDYIKAYEKLFSDGKEMSKYTCACGLMYDAGFPIKLIKTDESIHKLTTQEDIEIIKQLLNNLDN